MGWLNERSGEAAARKLRNRIIGENGPAIFESLWTEIRARVEEAREKGFPGLMADADPEVKTLILPPPESRTITIKFETSHQKIAVSGTVDLAFPLGMYKDLVCLTYEGKVVAIEEAARLILDPFLFPELQEAPESKPAATL